ncbi:MAG: NADH-quinone oxidoreductase subunit C [Desulforegulaceae bacterium]|nr:NADH-quinone oxidoreductase subunit C [Desulforegulaceae bacterium]
MDTAKFLKEIEKISVKEKSQDILPGVEYEFTVSNENIREFVSIAYKSEFMLLFVTAVHIEPFPVVIYQFVNPESKFRIRARVFCSETRSLPTISDIFNGASWYEREVMEFFGLDFEGHQDKRTLILDESDKGLNPLLKKEDKALSAEETGFKNT